MFFAQGVPVRFGLAHHFVQGIALGRRGKSDCHHVDSTSVLFLKFL
jgi:hypothetical protein